MFVRQGPRGGPMPMSPLAPVQLSEAQNTIVSKTRQALAAAPSDERRLALLEAAVKRAIEEGGLVPLAAQHDSAVSERNARDAQERRAFVDALSAPGLRRAWSNVAQGLAMPHWSATCAAARRPPARGTAARNQLLRPALTAACAGTARPSASVCTGPRTSLTASSRRASWGGSLTGRSSGVALIFYAIKTASRTCTQRRPRAKITCGATLRPSTC